MRPKSAVRSPSHLRTPSPVGRPRSAAAAVGRAIPGDPDGLVARTLLEDAEAERDRLHKKLIQVQSAAALANRDTNRVDELESSLKSSRKKRVQARLQFEQVVADLQRCRGKLAAAEKQAQESATTASAAAYEATLLGTILREMMADPEIDRLNRLLVLAQGAAETRQDTISQLRLEKEQMESVLSSLNADFAQRQKAALAAVGDAAESSLIAAQQLVSAAGESDGLLDAVKLAKQGLASGQAPSVMIMVFETVTRVLERGSKVIGDVKSRAQKALKDAQEKHQKAMLDQKSKAQDQYDAQQKHILDLDKKLKKIVEESKSALSDKAKLQQSIASFFLDKSNDANRSKVEGQLIALQAAYEDLQRENLHLKSVSGPPVFEDAMSSTLATGNCRYPTRERVSATPTSPVAERLCESPQPVRLLPLPASIKGSPLSPASRTVGGTVPSAEEHKGDEPELLARDQGQNFFRRPFSASAAKRSFVERPSPL
mmetsp:Transcript_38122/g.91551  ORF Transcript_38122/g.91551 Transcript_38122/m.91551 type:complete len:487 (+) Transcript_38122:17-1477(+)